MEHFADRLVSEIRRKGNPCVVGLDPRLKDMPDFITDCRYDRSSEEAVRLAIREFHELVIDVAAPLVPAVKLQIAEHFWPSGAA